MENKRLIEEIVTQLCDSDIVWPSYGSENVWQLAKKIVERLVEKGLL
jgi:hypothetical protein